MTGRYKPYPECKDSGVEWLEDIPKHWSARQLKFLCSCNDEVLSESLDDEFEIEYVDIGIRAGTSNGILLGRLIPTDGATSRKTQRISQQ